MQRTSNYEEAISWSKELGIVGKVAAAWIPSVGFEFATKNSDGSISLTRDGFGLGLGPNPIIEPSWSRFAISKSVPKELTRDYLLVNRWNPYFIETKNISSTSAAEKFDEVGIKEFLDENAPNSSTYPGNDEVQFWAGIKVAGELVAVGCLAKWESGSYIISSIATKVSERGKGYGRQITQAIVAFAAQMGIAEVFLAVNAKNEIAARVYEGIGFISLGQFNTFEKSEN